MAKKKYTGLNPNTTKRLSLGAGAFFIDFNVGTDTYDSAKAAGKILGATQGGGEFKALPVLKQIEVDGAVGRVAGLVDIEKWDVYIKATMLETSEKSIRAALAATKDAAIIKPGYTGITGKAGIEESDYLANITWVGNISGSEEPIIIQVLNALNEDGFTFQPQDGTPGKITCTFYGYNGINDYITGNVEPPFAIYYPTITTTTPLITPLNAMSGEIAEDSGELSELQSEEEDLNAD